MGPGIDRTYPASASKARKSALAEADWRGRVGRKKLHRLDIGLLHDLGPGRQLVDDGALELLAWDAGRLKAELAELLLDVRHRGDRQDRLAELAYPWPIHGNFAAVEADLALGRAPALVDALSTAAVGVPVSCCASSHGICSIAPIPAVRQKLSNELSTHCQAASRLGASVIDEGG
jgi:hypothetical protein